MAKKKIHLSEYSALRNAVHRCTNPKAKQYKDYGGRGIKVCDEWLNDFGAFLLHIGPKPSPDLTLDRIDNNRGYEPGNVRWATRSEQQKNQRPKTFSIDSRTLFLTIDGETLHIKEWSERSGVKACTIKDRHYRGITGKALIAPVKFVAR